MRFDPQLLTNTAKIIIGAAVAGIGAGIGQAYGSHLFHAGKVPLPWGPRSPRAGAAERIGAETDRLASLGMPLGQANEVAHAREEAGLLVGPPAPGLPVQF